MRRKTLVFALVTTHFESSDPIAQVLVKNCTRRPTEYGCLWEPDVVRVELPSIILNLESNANNQPIAPLHCLTQTFQELFDQQCSNGQVITAAGPVRHCYVPPCWRKEGWQQQGLVIPLENISDDFGKDYRWLPWPMLKKQDTHRFPCKTGETDRLLAAIEAHLQDQHQKPRVSI